MTSYEMWTLIGMWVGSIGTIGAVIYALFGATMRRWFNKPKLEFNISREFPHCELIKYGGAESNQEQDIFEICATLVNQKKYCAQHSRVLCMGIEILEANGKRYCPLLKFRPRQFQWSGVSQERLDCELDIGQSVLHFVRIAEISLSRESMCPKDKMEVGSQAPSVAIAIPDPNKPGQGYIRVPADHHNIKIKVQVLCSGCDPRNYDILIDWKGSSVDDCKEPAKLSVTLEECRQGGF